jgi:two-component system chemotaxis response regulator CheY
MQENRIRQFSYLVVDDSEFARKSLIKVLAAIGGTLAGEANSGLDAVRKYKKLKPDIVFMDITMPGVEGTDALEMIISEDCAAKVVMVSSLTYQTLVSDALRKGAKHFITKPVQDAPIDEIVRSVLLTEGQTRTTHRAP